MAIRCGGKFCDSHTTYIELAAKVADIAAKIDHVTAISAGFIQTGKGSTGGRYKVKIGDIKGGICLTVRQARSVQEVRLYVSNGQIAKLAVARALRDEDIPISFHREQGASE